MLNLDKSIELNGLSVLYVEDDDETREELEVILHTWFKQVYSAVNGLDGLELYRKYQPDIVISDIQMPEMNGLSMAADIKSINPDQEIIILSAYNDSEYLFRALEFGLKHYVIKPISLERLLEKLVDIKKQMMLEREASRNRKLLEQYKNLVDDKAIVAKFDTLGRISYANQLFCNLSGYTKEELLGRHYLFTFAENDQEQSLETLKAAVVQGKKWQGILKKTGKDGQRYVVDMSVMAIFDADDQLEEFIALMVDLTPTYDKFERMSISMKQDLNAQQFYMHEYEQAIELGTSMCMFDLEGRIFSSNQNFNTMLKVQNEDLIGKSFCDIVQGCLDFKKDILAEVERQGHTSKVVRISIHPDWERVLSTVIVGIHMEDGGLLSCMCLSQDITHSVNLNEEIIESQKELIYVMGDVMENRSQETGLHIQRVAQISHFLALEYGLSSDHAQMIKTTAPMHDIGKVGIPDEILHKKGKLSQTEFEIMQKHTVLGYQMLNKLDRPLIKMAAAIAHEHHEHFNGKGYPLGLQGQDIAIEARIVGLVDVFDALGSERSYKAPWTDQQIIDYLTDKKGEQFDPDLVDIFLENYDRIIKIRNQLRDKN